MIISAKGCEKMMPATFCSINLMLRFPHNTGQRANLALSPDSPSSSSLTPKKRCTEKKAVSFLLKRFGNRSWKKKLVLNHLFCSSDRFPILASLYTVLDLKSGDSHALGIFSPLHLCFIGNATFIHFSVGI